MGDQRIRSPGRDQSIAEAIAGGHFRYYDFVMAAFVAVLLLSNVIGAAKVAVIDLPGIGQWPFGAGILFFPISYVIGDVLTEVYGYARARRVIWAGFAARRVHGVHELGGRRAAAGPEGWTIRPPMRRCSARCRGSCSPRSCAFWAGEFVNSYVLARMKIWTEGASVDADDRHRRSWARGSTA